MTTQDISRFLFQPKKRYTGARLQQGRVLLDSDFNEDGLLDDEDQRRVLRDVIGPRGSPDEGFLLDLRVGDQVPKANIAINGTVVTGVLNYGILPGAFYVGGLRFDFTGLDPDPAQGQTGPQPERVAFQRDFLQMHGAEVPVAGTGTHSQLAVLHGWEQCVTAVEDEEILERALGGADTSVRIRRMRRVEVFPVDPADADDCVEAWDAIRAQIESAGGGTINADGELISNARLRVTFDPQGGESEDPCAPCAPANVGRYLGANNQAVRIMLANADGYVFALDNASALFRVKIDRDVNPGTATVEMLTVPEDVSQWPLQNTVIELLPWSAVLDNGQKVAAEVGVFARVSQGFDPDTNTFEIEVTSSVATALDQLVRLWDPSHTGLDLPRTTSDEDFLFMRMWHRLANDTDPVVIPKTNNDLLARLGLLPQFSGGTGRPGDYWVVTLRPDTPQQIVPWDLTRPGGIAPHGPRHFYAPTALVRFRQPTGGEGVNTEVVDAIDDCRARFRPLAAEAICCVHTVGDGVTSHGDFNTIAAAVRALPVDGGKVCILPGTYPEEVLLERNNVTLEGCGARTLIRTPENPTQQALIRITGSGNTVRSFAVRAEGQIGVLVGNATLEPNPSAPTGTTIEELSIDALPRIVDSELTQNAIRVGGHRISETGRDEVRILNNEVTMDGSTTGHAAVWVRAVKALIEGNRIETLRNQTVPGARLLPLFTQNSVFAWGGLQIAGGSSDIDVRQNHIVGGMGHSITLGNLDYELRDTGGIIITTTVSDPGNPIGTGHCPEPSLGPATIIQVTPEQVLYPKSGGDLERVSIVDNRVEGASFNGISVLTMFVFVDAFGPLEAVFDIISVDDLLIERNQVTGNVLQPFDALLVLFATPPDTGIDPDEVLLAIGQLAGLVFIPMAGIALGDGERITVRDNVIRDNAPGSKEPICGVVIAFGDAIAIEGNRIQNNGARAATQPLLPGIPGGIVSFFAGAQVEPTLIFEEVPFPLTISDLGTSLRVVNNIVEQPAGHALFALTTGATAIEGNFLSSRGNNLPSQLSPTAFGLGVSVVTLGFPWESREFSSSDLVGFQSPNGTQVYLLGGAAGGPFIGFDGRLVFNNNQVTLQWALPGESANGPLPGLQVAVGLFSMDHITFEGNQLAANVGPPSANIQTGAPTPALLFHASIFGPTVNIAHNRIAEGVLDAPISLAAFAFFLANVTDNIATHGIFSATCQTLNGGASPPTNDPTVDINRGNLVWLRPSDVNFQNLNQAIFNFLSAGLCTFTGGE